MESIQGILSQGPATQAQSSGPPKSRHQPAPSTLSGKVRQEVAVWHGELPLGSTTGVVLEGSMPNGWKISARDVLTYASLEPTLGKGASISAVTIGAAVGQISGIAFGGVLSGVAETFIDAIEGKDPSVTEVLAALDGERLDAASVEAARQAIRDGFREGFAPLRNVLALIEEAMRNVSATAERLQKNRGTAK